MRVYISADIEGCTGLVSWSQCGRPNSNHYDYPFARRMMTGDVLAAVQGAVEAGADEVVIKDSHGNSKNLLIEAFDGLPVRLISGHGSHDHGMMVGVESGFDVAFLVGYHAMAGTLHGVMEHTVTGGVHRLWVNGAENGEIGLSAGVAAAYNVPIGLVTSDRAGAQEADRQLYGVTTVSVKDGLGRYMANCLPSSQTQPMIREAAKKACQSINQLRCLPFEHPCVIRIEFNRAEQADYCMRGSGVSRVDAYTVEVRGETYLEAHRAAWMLFGLSFPGSDAGD